jgi:hypothetical protein
MPKTGIALDTREFQAALVQYAAHSKRDMAFIVNKRGINVSFIAMRKTPSASAARIERGLRKRISVDSRKGKKKPPMAALIIASGSEKAGKGGKPSPGLYGSDMQEAIETLIRNRQRTRAYIKSGFLKTIRDLERAVPGRAKRQPSNVQNFSRQPGEGRGARAGINPTAQIINHASNASKIAGPALQKALAADAADMRKFTAKRMQKTANKFKG